MECPAGNTTAGNGSTSKDSCYMSRCQIIYVQHISVTLNYLFYIFFFSRNLGMGLEGYLLYMLSSMIYICFSLFTVVTVRFIIIHWAPV